VLLLRSRACVVVPGACVSGASGHFLLLFVVAAGACLSGASVHCRLLLVVVAGACICNNPVLPLWQSVVGRSQPRVKGIKWRLAERVIETVLGGDGFVRDIRTDPVVVRESLA
jgi:hypothetical protein